MPKLLPHHTRPFFRTTPQDDPYACSDEESSIMSSQYSYSQSSIPSRSSRGGSISSRRETQRLMRNRDALMISEMQLNEERRRGRWMLCACVLLGCLCMVLFKDRWPDDMRNALIKFLDSGDGDGNKSSSSSVENSADSGEFLKQHSSHSHGNKHNTNLQQFSRDDPASGTSTAMSEYLKTQGKKPASHSPETSNASNIGDASAEDASPPGVSSKIIADLTEKEKNANKEAALMEVLEQHLDNLSKYLKWNLPYKSDRDVPYYWAVPMSGSLLVDQVLGKCYGLVQAAEQVSHIKGHEEDKILNVLIEDGGKKYVNVDMGTMGGIKRAQELHLTTSRVADLIRSPFVYEVAMLFSGTAKYGKCFTMVRNPIDRAVDVFRNVQSVTTNDVFKEMNIEEYAKSSFMEDNWMVRVLANEMDGKIEQHHLDLAQHVLGRKCLIGLTEKFEESILRFAHFFDWTSKVSKEQLETCEADLEIAKHVENQNFSNADAGSAIKKEDYKEGTELYKILEEKNSFDMELFRYAQGLFHRQELYS